jgi:cytidylate kinase
MEKKHIITISGKPGSGKSSTADRVADLLGYARHSSGDLVRTVLAKDGLTLAQYNDRAKSDHALDEEVDRQLRALRERNNIVVDSRLGFYWIPESFKVYLDLDMEVAAARIFNDKSGASLRSATGELAPSLEVVARQVTQRMVDERLRFMALYDIDPYEHSHFDLIVDTSRHSPQTVSLIVFDTYRQWLASDTWKQVRGAVTLGFSH